MKCEDCNEEGGMPRDTKQFLCDSCEEGTNTLYCSSCDSVIHEDQFEFFGSQETCPCGAKLDI